MLDPTAHLDLKTRSLQLFDAGTARVVAEMLSRERGEPITSGQVRGYWSRAGLRKKLPHQDPDLVRQTKNSNRQKRARERDRANPVGGRGTVRFEPRLCLRPERQTLKPAPRLVTVSRAGLHEQKADDLCNLWRLPEPAECATVGRPLLDLARDACRAPVGEGEEGHLFCGLRKYGALSFCQFHSRMNYEPEKGRRIRFGR